MSENSFWSDISASVGGAVSDVIEQVPTWVASSIDSQQQTKPAAQNTYVPPPAGANPDKQKMIENRQNQFIIFGVLIAAVLIVLAFLRK